MNIHTLDTRLKPDLVKLMDLYKANYILLKGVQECLGSDRVLLCNEHGYGIEIDKKYQTRYTDNLELHYSLRRQKAGREVVVALVCFKVRLYLDSRQAAVIFSRDELKQVFPVAIPLLSFRSKWYYNSCLKIILSRFFQLPVS